MWQEKDFYFGKLYHLEKYFLKKVIKWDQEQNIISVKREEYSDYSGLLVLYIALNLLE